MLDLELLASIASGGLGQWVEDRDGKPVYVKSDDCIGCLKDLQRSFRHDDPGERPAFFAVHKFGLARSDLVPLIVTYPDEYDVVYNALKVATFLTMPSSAPAEASANLAAQGECVQRVREAFLAQDALAVVVGLLGEPLARHPRMRDEDAVMVQLVITFLRNLVAFPPLPPPSAGNDTAQLDARRRIQAGLLERLFADNVMDLLLLLAQHAQQRPFRSEAPVLVETFLHLVRDLEPEHLLGSEAAAAAEAAQRAKQAAALAAAQSQSQLQSQAAAAGAAQRGGRQEAGGDKGPAAAAPPRLPLPKLPPRPGGQGMMQLPRALVGNKAVAQAAPSRHSRSDAVFVRRHADHNRSIVLRHNPNRTELPQLPAVADKKQAQAQRRDGGAGGAGRGRLPASLLVRMKGFFESFLEGGYCILMGQVFREVQPGLGLSRLDEPDFLRFVELATLATKYIRVKEEQKLRAKQQQGQQDKAAGGGTAGAGEGQGGDEEEPPSPFAPISATMGWDTFYWCLKLWLHLCDTTPKGMKSGERPLVEWQLQHAAVPMLKEMLLALDLARLVGTPSDRRAADRLQRRLLHDDLKESGLLPVLSRLIMKYNFRYQPRSHAVDLVEALHVVLGMMDRLSAAEQGGFRVRQKARNKPAKQRHTPKHAAPQIGDSDTEQQQQQEQQGEQQQQAPGSTGQDKAGSGAAAAAGSPAAAAGEAGQGGNPGSSSSPRVSAERQGDGEAGAGKEGQAGRPSSPAAAALSTPGAAPAAAPSSDGAGGSAAAAAGESAGKAGSPAAGETPAPAGTAAAAAAAAPAAAAAGPAGDADCISIAGTPAGARGGAGGVTSPPAPETGGRARKPLEEQDEEEEQQGPRYTEVQLDVVARVKQECANPMVVHFYSWLLQGYATNSPFTNHALMAFLARVADPQGLNLEPMLYQLSVLRVFHAILSDAPLRKRPECSELVRFCTRVVRNMFARLVPDLNSLHQAVEAAEAAEAAARDGAEVGENDAGSGDEAARRPSPQEAAEARRRAELEIKVKEGCASMGFVELLFWKRPGVAEDMREEYNWRKLVDPPSPKRRGGRRRGAGAGAGGDSGDESDGGAAWGGGGGGGGDGGRPLGRARSRKPAFDDQRAEQLRAAFEKVNGRKDCLDMLVHEFGGLFKKGQVSRQLKAMGLTRGKFTKGQEERLPALYEEHKGAGKSCFELIAEDLGAGFSSGQVKRQLRLQGVLPTAGGKKARQAVAWAGLGSDEDSGDEAGGRAGRGGSGSGGEGGSMSPELGAPGGGFNSDSDAGSDSDGGSGFVSAKSDLEDDSEGEGSQLQQLASALEGRGKKKAAGARKAGATEPQLGSIEFGVFSDEEDSAELALGAGRAKKVAKQPSSPSPSPPAGAKQRPRSRLRKLASAGATARPAKRPQRPSGSSSGGDDDSDAGASFVSLQDSEGEEEAGGAHAGSQQQQRQQQQAAVGAATQELVPAPAAAKAAGRKGKRPAAAAALSDSDSDGDDSDAGGSFVTVQDSEWGRQKEQQQQERVRDDAATQELVPAPAAAKKRGPGAGGSTAKNAQQAQQAQQLRGPGGAKKKQRAAAASSPVGGGGGSGSDSESSGGSAGFVSAGEDEPEGEASPPRQQQPKKAKTKAAPPSKKAGTAAGSKKGSTGSKAAAKRRREAEAESGSSDDDAPIWSPPGKRQQEQGRSSKPAAAAAAATAAAAGAGQGSKGKENARAAAAANAGAGGNGEGKKRKQAPAGGVGSMQRAALEALRRKRLGLAAAGASGGEREGSGGGGSDLPPATEPFGDWVDTERPMEVDQEGPATGAKQQQQQGVKAAGRRLLKKAGGASAAAPAPVAMLDDDLEDF